MRAMLLGAGLGTRLRPLTDRLPKPAVPLLGRPLAHYAIDRLLAAGVSELAVNAHHLPDEVERVVRARVPRAVVSREVTLLGTGGGIRRAVTMLADEGRALDPEEPFLVSNADVLFGADLTAALEAHHAASAYATMIVRADPRAAKLGPVDVDTSGRVRRLLGAPADVAGPLVTRMFTGVSILSGAAILDLPETGCVVRQGFRRWIDRGEIVLGHEDPAPFRDLGSPAEYLAAHLDLLTGAIAWAGITPSQSFVDPSAIVVGAVIDHAVIGERARIEPGVRLERAVVWPDTVVRESDHDVILFPRGRLAAS